MSKTGTIYGINGPVIYLAGNTGFKMSEMVYVGKEKLVGEVISLDKDRTTIQVYEETSGLRPGEIVEASGEAVSVTLAPGILDNIFDGIERPLERIAENAGAFITRGISVDSLDTQKLWDTKLVVNEGDVLHGGDIYAEVQETRAIVHKCMVPPDLTGTVTFVASDGEHTIKDHMITLRLDDGTEKILTMIFAFAIAVCTIFSMVQISNLGAKAEGYSGVLQDLQKDESFQAENYPLIENDDSLQLIQIAESTGKELFLYVYQPSGETKNFTASSVNISTTINDEISFLTYKLARIDSDGTLYKYKVQNFTVKTDPTRYYVISSIYRPFDVSVDKEASGGNTVTEVNFAVDKQYTFGKINGKEYVNCVDIETIEITDKFVGFVRYENGFNLYASACDSHFVAFNTDKRIDSLLEADVYYTTQKYRWTFINFVGENTRI